MAFHRVTVPTGKDEFPTIIGENLFTDSLYVVPSVGNVKRQKLTSNILTDTMLNGDFVGRNGRCHNLNNITKNPTFVNSPKSRSSIRCPLPSDSSFQSVCERR